MNTAEKAAGLEEKVHSMLGEVSRHDAIGYAGLDCAMLWTPYYVDKARKNMCSRPKWDTGHESEDKGCRAAANALWELRTLGADANKYLAGILAAGEFPFENPETVCQVIYEALFEAGDYETIKSLVPAFKSFVEHGKRNRENEFQAKSMRSLFAYFGVKEASPLLVKLMEYQIEDYPYSEDEKLTEALAMVGTKEARAAVLDFRKPIAGKIREYAKEKFRGKLLNSFIDSRLNDHSPAYHWRQEIKQMHSWLKRYKKEDGNHERLRQIYENSPEREARIKAGKELGYSERKIRIHNHPSEKYDRLKLAAGITAAAVAVGGAGYLLWTKPLATIFFGGIAAVCLALGKCEESRTPEEEKTPGVCYGNTFDYWGRG